MLVLEEENADLLESCKLFEVSSPDSKQLGICRRHIAVLKQLWDLQICVQVDHPFPNLRFKFSLNSLVNVMLCPHSAV